MKCVVPELIMSIMDCLIASINSSSSALESATCLTPSGGLTISLSERPYPSSLMMESPIWIWPLIKDGQTTAPSTSMIFPSLASFEISMIFPSSTTMFSRTGSKSWPFNIIPFAIVNIKIKSNFFY